MPKHALEAPRTTQTTPTRWPHWLIVLALLSGVVVTGAVTNVIQVGSERRALRAAEYGLLGDQTPDSRVRRVSRGPVTVGMRFDTKNDGSIVGLRYYKRSWRDSGTPSSGALWDHHGRQLASATITPWTGKGWAMVTFAKPVRVEAGEEYTVSTFSKAGKIAVSPRWFTETIENHHLSASSANNGAVAFGREATFPDRTSRRGANFWVDVRFVPDSSKSAPEPAPSQPAPSSTAAPAPSAPPSSAAPSPSATQGTPTMAPSPTKSTSTPTPTSAPTPSPSPTYTPTPSPTMTPTPTPTTPSPSTGWPGPDNTGAPPASQLSAYKGPCTITSTVTIDHVDATNCLALLIKAPNVVIKNSVVPRVDATAGGRYSVTVQDSTVKGGDWVDGSIWGYNITAVRVEVTGGQHSFHCGDNCTLIDSWLHDQYNPNGGSAHNNAFISNGGADMLVRHNTLHCTPTLNKTGGGCTADFSLFGDFEPISRVTVENNLLKANNSSISYCLYGGEKGSKPYGSDHVVIRDNVFERGANGKCGVYGPVTGFDASAPGNVWSNNRWTDGSILNP